MVKTLPKKSKFPRQRYGLWRTGRDFWHERRLDEVEILPLASTGPFAHAVLSHGFEACLW